MNNKARLLYFVIGMFIFASLFNLARAADSDPVSVDSITQEQAETFNASLYPYVNITAEAGNVTELTIYGQSQTIHWQGWYGNITGTIKLEDAQGNVLYNWSSAEPQGEIYAARSSSINWDGVDCFADSGVYSYLAEESAVDITWDDSDGVNETFTTTDHPEFWLGSDSITNCPTAWTFVNSAIQSARFPLVLLEDDANSIAVYTTIIENRDDGNATDYVGFDGAEHDFQLMVPENGTRGNTATTEYFFWVQLE